MANDIGLITVQKSKKIDKIFKKKPIIEKTTKKKFKKIRNEI